MQPSGQALWFFLLTGPFTGPIPGMFRAGKAAMAEELGWSIEAFEEAFREALTQGMVRADFNAKFVWLPNAIKHNRPESPNVIRSWGKEFDLLPECELKTAALVKLKAFVGGLSTAHKKAFEEAFREALKKPLPKTIPNQEQEQEQEQDKDQQRETKKFELEIQTSGNNNFLVTDELIDSLKGFYPAVEVEQQLKNIAGYFNARPGELKPQTKIIQFIHSWMQNRADQVSQERRVHDDPLGLNDKSWINDLVFNEDGTVYEKSSWNN